MDSFDSSRRITRRGRRSWGMCFRRWRRIFRTRDAAATSAEDELARRKRPIDARRRDELRETFDRADIVFDYHFGASVPEYLLDGDVSEFDDSLLEATLAASIAWRTWCAIRSMFS